MQICVPVNSVQSIIIVKKWKEQGALSKKPRMGDPRKITARAIDKLNTSLKKDSTTFRNELVDDMASIRVNVTRQTVTNAQQREGLRRRRARKSPLLRKKHLCARKQFATEMLKKEDKCYDKIKFCGQIMKQKMNYLATITIMWFGKNRTRPTGRRTLYQRCSMVEVSS